MRWINIACVNQSETERIKMDICYIKLLCMTNLQHFLLIYWESIKNKPSVHWTRIDSIPSCVSNMKRIGGMRRTWKTQQNKSAENRRQCRSRRENSDTDRERQRHGGQKRRRRKQLCVRKFDSFCFVDAVASVSLWDFDEAVPELISKPNSPCTQWLWFTLSLFTLTAPPLSFIYHTGSHRITNFISFVWD